MTGQMVPAILLPRFTSYVGPGTYVTSPMEVDAFRVGTMAFFRGPLVGGAAMNPFRTWVELSHDAVVWSAIAAMPISTANTTTMFAIDVQKRFLRVRTELQADGTGLVGISLWMAGTFETRVAQS